jgi:hypothetical protein
MLDQAARNGTVMGLLFSGGSQGHLELNDLEAVSIEDSELAVTESSRRGGDRDPSGARVGAILQALIAREPVQHRPTIRAWLPHGFVAPQVTRDCRATTCCTGVQTLSDACTVGRRVHKRATRAANRGQSFATALLVWCCTKLSNVCRARSPAQSSVVVSPRKGDGTIGNSKTRRQARSELLPAADRGFGGNGARQRARPLCSSAQNCNDYRRPRRLSCSENIMLFIVGAVLVVVAIVNVPRMRLPGGGSRAHLGWMSEHWLAELHASHSS